MHSALRFHSRLFGENVFAEGTKAARAPADLAEEYLEVRMDGARGGVLELG